MIVFNCLKTVNIHKCDGCNAKIMKGKYHLNTNIDNKIVHYHLSFGCLSVSQFNISEIRNEALLKLDVDDEFERQLLIFIISHNGFKNIEITNPKLNLKHLTSRLLLDTSKPESMLILMSNEEKPDDLKNYIDQLGELIGFLRLPYCCLLNFENQEDVQYLLKYLVFCSVDNVNVVQFNEVKQLLTGKEKKEEISDIEEDDEEIEIFYRLYFKNVPKSLEGISLLNILKSYGPVYAVTINDTEDSTNTAIAEFRNKEDALSTLMKANYMKIDNHQIRISYSDSEFYKSTDKDKSNIVIKNLSKYLTEHHLFTFYKQFGIIYSIRMTRKVCYICFETRENALVAMNKTNNLVLMGQKINVEWYKSEKKKKK